MIVRLPPVLQLIAGYDLARKWRLGSECGEGQLPVLALAWEVETATSGSGSCPAGCSGPSLATPHPEKAIASTSDPGSGLF